MLLIGKNGAYVNSTNWERLNYSESTSNRQAFSSRALHYIWENGMILFFLRAKKRLKTHVWIFNIELFKISLWKKENPNLAAHLFLFFFFFFFFKNVTVNTFFVLSFPGLRGLFGKFMEFGHKMFKYRYTPFIFWNFTCGHYRISTP